MSQNDLSIANQGFPSFRSDLNSALQALGSTNSGTSAPSTTYANQLWYDTTNNILYIRNEDNDAWIKLFTLDQTNDNVESLHADTIAEATSGSGVTIDSVLLKDGELGSTSSAVPIHSSSLNGGQFGGRRNIILNPKMEVAQRGISFANIGTSAIAYGLDRFGIRNATDGAVTVTQDTSVPNTEFLKSMKLDVTTADSSIGSSQVYSVQYRVEGQDLAQLGFGQSGTRYFTLSFYHKHTKTGTHCVGITNSAGDRSYAAEYTQSVSDTWEQAIIVFPVDTTGTWLTTNAVGLRIYFVLAAGSTFHGTADTWSADNTFATSNQVNNLDSTSNNFFLTGIQMEVGSTATPFEHRSFGEEQQLCFRYYCNLASFATNSWGQAYSTTQAKVHINFPVKMRATPTMTYNSPFTSLIEENGISVRTPSNLATNYTSTTGNIVGITSTYTTRNGVFLRNIGTDTMIEASAEL